MSTIKQLPTNISDEDLLNQLAIADETTAPKKRRITNKSHVLRFLTLFNVEPGQSAIEQKILYELYKQYEKTQHPNKPLTAQKLYRVLKNYLKWGRQLFYINQKSLDLSERVINFIRPGQYAQTKVIPMQLHFNNFMKKFDLKSGKHPNSIWVSTKTLYDLYDEWVYEIRKKRPLSYKEFTNFCKIYFTNIKRTESKIWLSLDDSISTTIKARNSYKNEQEQKEEPKE